MGFIKGLMDQYGYLVLFLSLMLELVAVPIPVEVLMSYSGFLVYEGKMDWILSIVMAGLGSCAGMTIAYLIGNKLGAPFFHKYGHHIHLGPDRLDKIGKWFTKYGNKVLIIGYFIPGVRHVTAYFSGISKVTFRDFAIYAYIGAFIWASTFISLGKVLGPKWTMFHGPIKNYLIISGTILAVMILGIYLYRNYKEAIFKTTKKTLEKMVQTFHSLRRVRALILVSAVVFLGLFLFMLSFIQDYLGNEFTQFDTIALFLVSVVLRGIWPTWMKSITLIASFKVLLVLVFITLIWIWMKGKNRSLEGIVLLFIFFGEEILEAGLRYLFQHIGSIGSTLTRIIYALPNEQSFLSIAVFGMIGFLLIRHSKNVWSYVVIPLVILSLSIIIGINIIIFGADYPSDVIAGYVFGGVWLSLNIMMLEIFRFLSPTRTT